MQASAVERGDANPASQNAYRQTALLYEKANTAPSSLSTAATVGGVFAVIVYLADRFTQKSTPHAHAMAGAASASPVASWVSQLPHLAHFPGARGTRRRREGSRWGFGDMVNGAIPWKSLTYIRVFDDSRSPRPRDHWHESGRPRQLYCVA